MAALPDAGLLHFQKGQEALELYDSDVGAYYSMLDSSIMT